MALKNVTLTDRHLELSGEATTDDKRYLVTPANLEYLPLMVAAKYIGYNLLVDDPVQVSSRMNLDDQDQLPANFTVGEIGEIELDFLHMPDGPVTFRIMSDSVTPTPWLHLAHESVYWETVTSIVARYKLTHSDGTHETLVVRPDMFIYENEDSAFHTFALAGEEGDTKTYDLLDGFLQGITWHKMMRPMSLMPPHDANWYTDYKVVELRIHAALASGREELALMTALHHFGVPLAAARKLPGIMGN